MAMPMDYDKLRTDEASERANSVEDYKVTCINFIKDISSDYKEWVDYYKLPKEEDQKRRSLIDATVERTTEWLAKVPQSIKGVDVVMNDGIQKMAEATAGKSFQIGIFVNGKSSYTLAKAGLINVSVKASGREGRQTRLGYHFKNDRFRLEASCGAFLDEDELPLQDFDLMDINLRLHADEAKNNDVISFTVTVCETKDGEEIDRRGHTTLVHIV